MEIELISRKNRSCKVRSGLTAEICVATMAGTSRAPERRRNLLIDLPKEILGDILLLLQPKYIIRCRAVCKALRHVASDHALLLAHHRGQPPRRLLTFVRDVGGDFNYLDLVDYCVEALDLRTHEFQSIIRFTGDDYDFLEVDCQLDIHAACDGLLLMSFRSLLYLCNPTTRQWVSLSRPAPEHDTIMGLYAHASSSEYRVLYCRRNHGNPLFFISTVDSGIERCICPSLSYIRNWLGKRSEAAHFNESFLFNSNLHWLPCVGQQSKILVFDTMKETFRWLRVPFKIRLVASFLEVEGKLAISNSDMGSSEVDVWLLLDYGRAEWVHKCRIKLPVLDIQRFQDGTWFSYIVSQERDVYVDGSDWQLHYDLKGNLLKKFQCNGRMLNFTTHILRESLVSHAFFRMPEQENGGIHAPPFFQGL